MPVAGALLTGCIQAETDVFVGRLAKSAGAAVFAICEEQALTIMGTYFAVHADDETAAVAVVIIADLVPALAELQPPVVVGVDVEEDDVSRDDGFLLSFAGINAGS